MDEGTIRDYRRAWRMTQSELAEQLGVHVNTLARWERGELKVPPYLALALRSIDARHQERATA